MIEVALSLAIVAFALVAILGVLPTGMQVQRDNREDTLINLDGMFLLETLRSGSRGVDDLTNYVESISIATGKFTNEFTNLQGPLAPGVTLGGPLLNGETIVGLLSKPQLELDDAGKIFTNRITARIRSINGAAAEKGNITNDFAFRYQALVEVGPHLPSQIPPLSPSASPDQIRAHNQLENELVNTVRNLYDIRLVLRWPLYQRGNLWVTGRNRKSFRTLAGGNIATSTNQNSFPAGVVGFILQPNTFTNATPNL